MDPKISESLLALSPLWRFHSPLCYIVYKKKLVHFVLINLFLGCLFFFQTFKSGSIEDLHIQPSGSPCQVLSVGHVPRISGEVLHGGVLGGRCPGREGDGFVCVQRLARGSRDSGNFWRRFPTFVECTRETLQFSLGSHSPVLSLHYSWEQEVFTIHHHHHHQLNIHILPSLIKSMNGCFPTVIGRQSTFSRHFGISHLVIATLPFREKRCLVT